LASSWCCWCCPRTRAARRRPPPPGSAGALYPAAENGLCVELGHYGCPCALHCKPPLLLVALTPAACPPARPCPQVAGGGGQRLPPWL
jgi:hypothetical protein